MVDAEHLGHRDAALGLGQPAQPGGLGLEEAAAVRGGGSSSRRCVPSESRSLVAVAMSPPAIGAVATTEAPSSSSARLATSG